MSNNLRYMRIGEPGRIRSRASVIHFEPRGAKAPVCNVQGGAKHFSGTHEERRVTCKNCLKVLSDNVIAGDANADQTKNAAS